MLDRSNSVFGGIRVVADPAVPEFKESHRQERKWARRVMFERYRRFDIKYERVMFCYNGQTIVHPNTYLILQKVEQK